MGYSVRDFLTAHCKKCSAGVNPSGSSGCNPSPNFTQCRDSAGASIDPTFPAQDLHTVLRSEDFRDYLSSLADMRYMAGHGHENTRFAVMTGFKYNSKGWFGYLGGNYSMPTRSVYKVKREWYDKTEAFVEANSAVIPQIFATCDRYLWMVTENALQRNTYVSCAIAVVFAWVMLVLTGWNWWTGTMGFIAVVSVCIVSCALMVGMGWELGVIESIAIITVVGVSVDYSVHLIHAYGESSADTSSERVQSALKTLGISLIGGVATTVGAALFLWFAQIQFFSKFGQFLASTVIVSLAIALTFLMPAAILIGPVGRGGTLCAAPCCKRKKGPKP